MVETRKNVIYSKFLFLFTLERFSPDSDTEYEILSKTFFPTHKHNLLLLKEYLFSTVTLIDPETFYQTLFLIKKKNKLSFQLRKARHLYKYSHLELNEF